MAIAHRVDLLGRAAVRVEVGGQFLNGPCVAPCGVEQRSAWGDEDDQSRPTAASDSSAIVSSPLLRQRWSELAHTEFMRRIY